MATPYSWTEEPNPYVEQPVVQRVPDGWDTPGDPAAITPGIVISSDNSDEVYFPVGSATTVDFPTS